MNERDIFAAAIEKQQGDERLAYLAEACAEDAGLRQRVDALLVAHGKADRFLESSGPVFAKTVVSARIAEGPGTVIGPYRLLEQIGEGGFGVVFMAEQSAPVRRKVALKVIKPGMDTRQVIARFEAERQALALMDHPHIAKVFDAGTTDSGRPYFVMELVRGIPITDFCDQHQLTVLERLELFVTVCQAAQHAHQKGIIHRDIKPSNVLVTLHDDKPIVKVIDFGVAKATSGHLTDKTLFTGFMQMLGTPLYMSPEQTALSGIDVDTRSDIYSLGVLLYELLTGTTPFDRQQFEQAAIDEVRRIIREQEPKKPSTRVSTIGDSLPTLCAHRKIEPRKLGQLLRGDLDWIVMKALEKDRTRRYETANDFARDVQRYLADEVVEARPPSTGYRLRKMIRRNKVALTAGGLVALALIAGSLVSTWQAIRAHNAEEATRQSLEAERIAHQEAENNLKRARDAVDDYFTIVSQSTLLNVPGLQPLRKDLMEAAVKYYESLLKERGDEPTLLADLAAAHIRVGVIYHEINRNNDTFEHVASAMEIAERLFRDYPEQKDAHRRLAGFWKGKRARSSSTDTPQDYPKAERTLKKFVELWEKLAQEFPQIAVVENDLAAVQLFLAMLQASRAHDPQHRDMIHPALESGRKAIAIWEGLCKTRPDEPDFRESLMLAHKELSYYMRNAGQFDEAAASRARALELAEKLTADYPQIPQYRVYLIDTLNGHADLLQEAGKSQEAANVHQRRFQMATELAAQYPTVTDYSDLMAATMEKYTKVTPMIANTQRLAGGGGLNNVGLLGLFSKGAMREPSPQEESIASRLNNTAWSLVAAADSKVWQPERAVELARLALDQSPRSGLIWNTLGVARYRAGDWKGAGSALRRSMELRWGAPAYDYFFLAMTLSKQDDMEQARKWYHGACLWMDTFDPQNAELVRFRAEAAALLDASGHASVEKKRDDLAVAQSFVELHPAPTPYGLLAVIHAERGEWKQAAESFANAIGQSELDWYWHYERALALCIAGDMPRYQAACADMLRQFGETSNSRTLHFTAWSCLLGPGAGPDYAPVLTLVEKAAKVDPKSLTFGVAWGAALYRAGRWGEAAQKLMEANSLVEGAAALDTSPAYGWFFLAMAHHRLQQRTEAKKWFDKACEEMDRALYEHESGKVKLAWNRRATLKLLRSEAAAVLTNSAQGLASSADRASLKKTVEPVDPATESHWTLRTRAERRIRAFEWAEAKSDAVRAGELRPEDDDFQNRLAPLLARTDDLSAYREQCRKLLARHANTTDPVWAERTSKACLIVPLDGDDLAAASRLAEKALTLDEKHWVIPFAQVAAAMAAYRRGEFQASLELCNKALARENENVWFRNAQAYFVRALALGRLGQFAEASVAFEKASVILKFETALRTREIIDPSWQDFAICEVLQQEAETLLSQKPAQPVQPARSAADSIPGKAASTPGKN